MLNERSKVSQNDENSRRRWYWNDRIDLIIWYDLTMNDIQGFQLCYRLDEEEKAFTWREGAAPQYTKIDGGETLPTKYKQSPILLADGPADTGLLLEMFLRESQNIEPELRNFITSKLQEA